MGRVMQFTSASGSMLGLHESDVESVRLPILSRDGGGAGQE